jgi:hypothetical protein
VIEGPVEFDYQDTGPGTGLVLNSPAFTNHTILGGPDKGPGAWQSPFYWYRLLLVDGLWDEDVNFEVHNIPQQNRARSGDAYTGGKTLTLTGRVEAQNLAYLRQGQAQLKIAFADMQPHNLYFRLFDHVDGDGKPQYTRVYFKGARKNQKMDMPEAQTELAVWRRPFVVQLWVDDPKIYLLDVTDTVYDAFTT